jgi:hypothetical protein
MTVSGVQTRETDMGSMEFPVISGWPNQGVGRINPDGSKGSCASCHSRHEFSVEMARKPYTCKECHAGPDVPAFKVYETSKHGNIFSAVQKEWDFKNTRWTVGKDFTAPTCAVCHISLLVNGDGKVIANRTHEMKDRLPWRIFGLVYAHPQPKEADTSIIRNADGLPLPTDFVGKGSEKFLQTKEEMAAAQQKMESICLACHSQSWVDGYWGRFANTIESTNSATFSATQIMTVFFSNGRGRRLWSFCRWPVSTKKIDTADERMGREQESSEDQGQTIYYAIKHVFRMEMVDGPLSRLYADSEGAAMQARDCGRLAGGELTS